MLTSPLMKFISTSRFSFHADMPICSNIVAAPKPTPTPPGSDIWDSESLSIDSSEESEEDGPSHYIPCLAKDRGYCLHGGQCQMLTDGRYKHCR